MFLLIGSVVAQFNDERQHAVVFSSVEGKIVRLQQVGVQFFQLLHHHAVNLQMSAFAQSLAVHHADEVAKPVGLVLFLFVGVLKLVDILLSNACQRTVVGTYDVLHLPHIQQIFGNAFLS